MDDETLGSLRQIIEYLWDDEQKSYQEDGEPSSHIYHDLVRVNEWLARESKDNVLTVGDVVMDLDLRTVTRGQRALMLNRKEFSLLEYLMRNAGVVQSREAILKNVWDVNTDPFTNTVDVHIRFLRKKLDDGFKRKLITTVHGTGYRFEAE
jgi:DNA-binding response OmpR family regulator